MMFKLLIIISTCTLGLTANDSLIRHLFLGQSFASGNVYLISFKDKNSWPKNIHFYSINKDESVSDANFISKIPLCSKGSYFYKQEKVLAKVDYFKEAFFSTIADDCVEEEVGLYKNHAKTSKLYNIIASDAHLTLKNISYKNSGKARTLQESEKKSVATNKQNALEFSKTYECSTEPAYLDDAKIIMEFKVAKYDAVLSSYFNPGCAGHLSDIYLLDLFKDGNFVKSYLTSHYEGGI